MFLIVLKINTGMINTKFRILATSMEGKREVASELVITQQATGTFCVRELSGLVLSDSLPPVDYSPPLYPMDRGFPRQEYWSGLLFPPSGDLPDPGIKPASPVSPTLASRFFTTV